MPVLLALLLAGCATISQTVRVEWQTGACDKPVCVTKREGVCRIVSGKTVDYADLGAAFKECLQ